LNEYQPDDLAEMKYRTVRGLAAVADKFNIEVEALAELAARVTAAQTREGIEGIAAEAEALLEARAA
jgi:hypothetical protein